jgi:hypothetical protein
LQDFSWSILPKRGKYTEWRQIHQKRFRLGTQAHRFCLCSKISDRLKVSAKPPFKKLPSDTKQNATLVICPYYWVADVFSNCKRLSR